MFGRNNIVRIIKKGDLDKLKEALEKDPGIIQEKFRWEIRPPRCYFGNILHLAAFYNQPAIVEFLVTEKGMDVNQTYFENSRWAPLHHAARNKADLAIKMLFDLGADARLTTADGKNPYDLCKNKKVKEHMHACHAEKLQQKAAAAEQKKAEREEELQQEAAALAQEEAAKIKGTWTSILPNEITHEYELPGHRYLVTESFNFVAKHWSKVTENLQTGKVSPPETKFFGEMADKEILVQAQAELERIQNGSPADTEPAVEAEALVDRKKPEKQSYDQLSNAFRVRTP